MTESNRNQHKKEKEIMDIYMKSMQQFTDSLRMAMV
jgi:hypothetical protein